MPDLNVIDAGLVEYESSMVNQAEILEKRIKNEIPDTLIFLEYYPVVTLGRITDEAEVLNKVYFEKNYIPVIRSSRGGENTFHAPGQIVLYPVIDLKNKNRDIKSYIDLLEKAAKKAICILGASAERKEGVRGVWVKNKKIAFIGIAVKKWVTYHGISINVNNSTEAFRYMHPCGEKGIEVTSLKDIMGKETDLNYAKRILTDCFEELLRGSNGI